MYRQRHTWAAVLSFVVCVNYDYEYDFSRAQHHTHHDADHAHRTGLAAARRDGAQKVGTGMRVGFLCVCVQGLAKNGS